MKSIVHAILCLQLCLLTYQGAIGQEAATRLEPLWERTRIPQEIRVREFYFKHHKNSLLPYCSIVAETRQSTLEVIQDAKQVALATVVASNGFAVTKASELNSDKNITCKTMTGELVTAEVVGQSKRWDLALLKVDADNLMPARIGTSSAQPLELGTFLASVGISETPLSIGAVSVMPRTLRRGFLGIIMGEANDGVRVREVLENSAAEKSGIKTGDIIVEVDGQRVRKLPAIAQLIGSKQPDDTVKIKLLRGDNEEVVSATLGERQFQFRTQGAEAMLRTRVNKKRTGFPMVFQHDLFLEPNECGGPVVDLDGRIVGINIARYDRVTSYAIPAELFSTIITTDSDGEVRFADSDDE